ncbi:MAG: hypothetical protein OEV72_09460 [Thermoleophilia bacterium]|nr:hypothetical protein [Thermoleophilia bacterium]
MARVHAPRRHGAGPLGTSLRPPRRVQLWGLDAASDALVVKANCAPVAPDPSDLPDDGWREAVRTAADDEQEPTVLCALQIQVARARLGPGLSRLALAQPRRVCVDHGFADLVAPVRPSPNAHYPLTPA